MTVLVLAAFPDPAGADRAAVAVERLCRAGGVTHHGAATAHWHPGADRPAVRHHGGAPGVGAVDWSFWGLLLGVALRLPLAAASRGSAGGLTAEMLADVGIADQVLNRLRDDVVPGRSALLVLAPAEAGAPLVKALRALGGRTQRVDLDGSDERALWATFAA